MATPKNEVLQMEYQNPHAANPLYVPVLVICNTPDEELENNIRINSAKDLKWLKAEPEHDGIAVMIGGGPSINEHIDDIKYIVDNGGTVFAMNAASQWCKRNGINVDYQCIVDAKEETEQLVDSCAKAHLFASQCNSKTIDSVQDPILWHLEIGDVEDYFPEDKAKRGGYVLVGGGTAVGNTSLCVAYAMGYRKFHIFGYDSCHKDNMSHAYDQPMNKFIPTVEVEWAGKSFKSSVAMKAQAEKFQLTAHALKEHNCDIDVYGDGLLQTMYTTDYSDLSEKEKYQLMWQLDTYRISSPGERIADTYLKMAEPEGRIIDFGCGTGRAGIKFVKHGLRTLLIDFTDNCRDEEAQCIPFLQWDLTEPIPAGADHGFCTDVMEHIPTEDVETVIANIMNAAGKVFFQISTIDDSLGEMINEPLHLTVKPHAWWKSLFEKLGYIIGWDSDLGTASLFYISNPDRR